MKSVRLLFLFWLAACNNAGKPGEQSPGASRGTSDLLRDSFYSNQRFRNVQVEKLGEGRYRVTGQGQIFEARFGWVVEDGHSELARGNESTNAGAPEWGNFSFTVEAKKEKPASTLHLILFESSAKDGSRQHQLPVPLH